MTTHKFKTQSQH